MSFLFIKSILFIGLNFFYFSFVFFYMFLLFTGMYLPITFVYCIKTNVAFAEMEKQGTV